MSIVPLKLKAGDGVRVVAPARSLALPWISEELKKIAIQRFEEIGLNLSFGDHANEIDDFHSSSIQSRVADLHAAFMDPSIQMIITVIGGFNSNQLLKYLDYESISKDPKIICGYSDITALVNAIYAKTGMTTYLGPHFSSFGDKNGFDVSFEYFKKCFFSDEPFAIESASRWSDDVWMKDQENRTFIESDGFWVINGGEVEGRILGGNQCTFNLLHGTEFMPDIRGSILFLEDDNEAHVATIDRDLQSLIHQPGFEQVQAIVFGRFQPATKMTRNLLNQIIKTKKELSHIPVIANADFGHTTPMATIPIGGTAKLVAHGNEVKLEILKH